MIFSDLDRGKDFAAYLLEGLDNGIRSISMRCIFLYIVLEEIENHIS